MINYRNINVEPIPPIDLGIVANSASTIQQKHEQAIAAKSDLEGRIAALDLNEAEDEYRTQLFNRLDQAVEEDMFLGSDFNTGPTVAKIAGELSKDAELNGKLKAQKAYKDFITGIDNNKELTQDMKDMYKELNPYSYQPTFDKNGNVIGSKEWTPFKSPKSVVDLSKIVTLGIQRAAKEAGGGNATFFIDKNGNVTNNPTESFDGNYYYSTDSSYERLPKEKILQSIMAVIEETPGAKESLDQDYDVALWKHNKNKSSDELTVSDITGPNGDILSRQEYLMKRIEPGAAAAAYNNRISKTTYGPGLGTYTASRNAAFGAGLNEQGEYELTASGYGVPMQIETNSTTTALEGVNSAKETIKKIVGDDIDFDDEQALNNAYQSLKNSGATPEQLVNLSDAIERYKENTKYLDDLTEELGKKDREDYLWATRMQSGGQLIKGASKNDDKLINHLNNIFKDRDSISIVVPKDTMQIFDETFKGNLNDMGIQVTTQGLVIPKNSINYLPQVFNALYKSYNNSSDVNNINSNLYIKEDYDAIVANSANKYNPEGYSNSYDATQIKSTSTNSIRDIANLYDKSEKVLSKLAKKNLIAPENIEVSTTLMAGNTWNDNYYRTQYDLGIIGETAYNTKRQNADRDMDNFFNGDFSQYAMWVSEDGKTAKQILESKKRAEYSAMINSALQDKRLEYIPAFAAGIKDPISQTLGGYYVKVYDKYNGEEGSSKKSKQLFTAYIPGAGNESARILLANNPEMIATNDVLVANETLKPIQISTNQSHTRFGNISLNPVGNEIFVLNFKNNSYTLPKETAIEFITAYEQYKQIYNYFMAGGEPNERSANALGSIAKTLGDITDTSYDVISNYMVSEISSLTE